MLRWRNTSSLSRCDFCSDQVTKEDMSSSMVSAEAVMLSCVADEQEVGDVTVVNTPNALSQTVVSDDDEEHQVIGRIWEPLVEVPVSIALDVYGPCVMANKTVDGKQVRICFQAEEGKILCVSTKVVDKAIKRLQTKYESIFKDGVGAMKVHRGK